MTAPHFPPPWSVEEQAACFTACDHKRSRARPKQFLMRSASWEILSLKIYATVHGTSHAHEGTGPRPNAMETIVKLDSNGAVLVQHSPNGSLGIFGKNTA
jgi:hypothetical protein